MPVCMNRYVVVVVFPPTFLCFSVLRRAVCVCVCVCVRACVRACVCACVCVELR